MSRWTFVINRSNRDLIRRWLEKAPDGFRVEISEPKRTDAQNKLLWPILTAISTQVQHFGLRLSPDDWKDLLTARYRRDVRLVPNLDGDGMVALGMRTSNMTKAEFSDFLEAVFAFCAEAGVDTTQLEERAA